MMYDDGAPPTLPAPAPSRPDPAQAGSAVRMVYAYAADPQVRVPVGRAIAEVHAELGRPGRTEAGRRDSLDDLVDRARSWSAESGENFRALLDEADGDAARRAMIRRTALGAAPLALTSGAWLQWLSAPGNAEDAVVLRILALYAADVGVGHPDDSRGDSYLQLLRRLRISENAVPIARLAGDQRISAGAFWLPAVLAVMSRRPDDFTGELLGADLCLRAVGLLPPLALLQRALPTAVDWSVLDASQPRSDGERSPIEASRAAVDALIEQGGTPTADAVRLGLSWAFATLRDWTGRLLNEALASTRPDHGMAELIRQRAREGAVYHQKFQLAGRPLATWLAQARTNPEPLLAELATSKLIRPGRADASPLVRGLVSERGPMFRIFSPEDLSIIRRWIDALPATSESGPAVVVGEPKPAGTLGALADALKADVEPAGPRPADLRAAYHQLMTRVDGPALREWSLEYVTGWLARSRHNMDRTTMPLPEAWDSAGLRPWLQAQHDRHSAEFEGNADVPLPTREAVIDDVLQTAPLTLIDGSWLHGFTDYQLASSEIGHFLFETYWDELGNGEPRLNHPLLYRKVLHEMGIDLPPTASPEFARWQGFRDSSFELPVYWLCIGRFPRTFLPEILGLNLAMELSGVGGTYRRAGIALRSYGFSTRFVDIHNTIDNVATGHSAWAADAIDGYLAQQAPTARAGAWDRIRAGYSSLNPPSRFWARNASRRAREVLSHV
jgi:hypothetical protein